MIRDVNQRKQGALRMALSVCFTAMRFTLCAMHLC